MPSNQSVRDSRDHSEHWRRRLIHVESEGDFGRKLTSPEYTRLDMSVSARPAAAGSRFRALLVHANPFQRVTPVPAYGLERLRTAAQEHGRGGRDPRSLSLRGGRDRGRPRRSRALAAAARRPRHPHHRRLHRRRPPAATARPDRRQLPLPEIREPDALWARSYRRRPSSQEALVLGVSPGVPRVSRRRRRGRRRRGRFAAICAGRPLQQIPGLYGAGRSGASTPTSSSSRAPRSAMRSMRPRTRFRCGRGSAARCSARTARRRT